MTDRDPVTTLRTLDRPLPPSAEIAERTWRRVVASTGDALADERAGSVSSAPEVDRRWRSFRGPLLAAIAAAIAVIVALVAWPDRRVDRVATSGSGAAFRARVRVTYVAQGTSSPSNAGSGPTDDADPSGEFEQRVLHGGNGRWRVEWVSAPNAVGGAGSFQVSDGERLLTYRSEPNTYHTEKVSGDEARYTVVSYVDSKRIERDCDRVERHETGGLVAGRPTRLVQCFRDGSSRAPAGREDRWIDIQTGLLMRHELRFDDRLVSKIEVLEVDFAPTFARDAFSTQPPSGAKDEAAASENPLGNVLKVGSPAPSFDVARLGGGRLTTAELRGRPLVVLLWATWCEPCAPATVKAFDAQASRSSSVRLVSVALHDNEADVARRVADEQIDIPVGLDPDGKEVGQRWGLSAVPAYVFLDGAGVVAGVRVTPLPPDELTDAVDALAAGRPLGFATAPPPPRCDPPPTVAPGDGVVGAKGPIYFAVEPGRADDGCGAVPVGSYTIAPDGTGLEQLSDEPLGTGVAVSPKGEIVREVPTQGRRSGESGEVWLARASLQPTRKLVGRGSEPAWSNDGQRIAFVRRAATGRATSLGVINRDGSGERTVVDFSTASAGLVSSVAWEPGDSGLLVAVRRGGGEEGDIVRYAVADGRRSPCAICRAGAPAVSPRDGAVAFVHLDPSSPDHRRIALSRPDGSGRRFLTRARDASVPAFHELDFSPDGAWLVASGVPATSAPAAQRHIYLIEVATGNIAELVNLGGRPAW